MGGFTTKLFTPRLAAPAGQHISLPDASTAVSIGVLLFRCAEHATRCAIQLRARDDCTTFLPYSHTRRRTLNAVTTIARLSVARLGITDLDAAFDSGVVISCAASKKECGDSGTS
jgi:hypothetical protein